MPDWLYASIFVGLLLATAAAWAVLRTARTNREAIAAFSVATIGFLLMLAGIIAVPYGL